MSKKTWIWIGVVAGVAVVAYVAFSPRAAVASTGAAYSGTGTAAVIDASGRAVGSVAKLWSAIFDSGEDEASAVDPWE